MNMLTTLPGAAIGSESDTLPPKLTLVQLTGEGPVTHQAPDLGLDAMIARLLSLAIRVTAAGHYIASVEYHGAVESVSVDTHLADEPCNGPSASWHRLYLNWIGDCITLAEARAELEAMVAHLEQLLEASA